MVKMLQLSKFFEFKCYSERAIPITNAEGIKLNKSKKINDGFEIKSVAKICYAD